MPPKTRKQIAGKAPSKAAATSKLKTLKTPRKQKKSIERVVNDIDSPNVVTSNLDKEIEAPLPAPTATSK